MDAVSTTMQVPTEWTPAYTVEDKAKVGAVIAWFNTPDGNGEKRTQKRLSTLSRVNATTLYTIIAGNYPSSPTKWLDQMLDTITRDTMRETNVQQSEFVETSVYRAVMSACKRAHLYKAFSVVSAFVGTGKTTSVKRYQELHSNVILIEANPDMLAGVMLSRLVEKTGAVVHKASRHSRDGGGTKDQKMEALIAALTGSDTLIILDEAETVSEQTLEYLRRISDQAGVGVVLSGTEKLVPLLRDPRGRFGQISSRVNFWPPAIRSITEADANALTKAAFAHDDVDLSLEILDAFWQMCDGSARVLARSLIPGVRDFGLKQGRELTPELIYRVGQEILGFKKPSRKKEVA